MLLLLLSCLLPSTHGKSCLHCWPELPALMEYDLQILWGTPGPPTELSQSIHSMFLEKHVYLRSWYLGQDHLEEEASNLFNHISEAIKMLRDDKQQLLDEVQIQKQLFIEKLEERSEELKEKAPQFLSISPSLEACNESCDLHNMEVMDCSSCKKHILICKDPTLCPAAITQRNFLWAIILSVVLSLVIMAVGGFYIYQFEKKRKEGTKESPRDHKQSELRKSSHQFMSEKFFDKKKRSDKFTPAEQRFQTSPRGSSLYSGGSRSPKFF